MMPVSVASLPKAIGAAVERGIKRGIENKVRKYIVTPGVPQKAGVATGVLILVYGYRAMYRYERWQRIEGKIDLLLVRSKAKFHK